MKCNIYFKRRWLFPLYKPCDVHLKWKRLMFYCFILWALIKWQKFIIVNVVACYITELLDQIQVCVFQKMSSLELLAVIQQISGVSGVHNLLPEKCHCFSESGPLLRPLKTKFQFNIYRDNRFYGNFGNCIVINISMHSQRNWIRTIWHAFCIILVCPHLERFTQRFEVEMTPTITKKHKSCSLTSIVNVLESVWPHFCNSWWKSWTNHCTQIMMKCTNQKSILSAYPENTQGTLNRFKLGLCTCSTP